MSTTRGPTRNAAVATQAPEAAPRDKPPVTAKIEPESAFGAAVKNREVLGVGGMLALQAAAGNRAVTGLVHEAAKMGIGGTSGKLPHLERIQQSFGRHDVTGVVAHTGAQATAGAAAMGAAAFTMGNHVAFAGTADLHTAAHEAAHAVQQRAGVQLLGGVGRVGDRYERHADAVADLVVQGRSAEGALDGPLSTSAGAGGTALQMVRNPPGGQRTKRSINPARRRPGPRKAKWLRELEARQEQERQAQQRQNDRLTSGGTKDLLTDRIRTGVGGVRQRLGFANMQDLFQQALPAAHESYTEFARGHQLGKKFPPAAAISGQEDIERHAQRIRTDKSIESSDAREHLEGYLRTYPEELRKHQVGERPTRPLSPDEYLEDRHERSRIKNSGVWAEHASAYLSIARGAKGSSEPDEDPRDGRDLTGRLGYLLMTTAPADLFSGLTGGSDPKEGAPRKSGPGKLALDLEGIFSSAACHKDADQMLHLMAGSLISKGVETLSSAEHEAALVARIMQAIQGSKATSKVLKLTDKTTHSIAYLIGDKAAKLETIAAPNSDTILYNNLIHFKVNEVEVQTALKSGLSRIAMTYKRTATLEWDLYEGVDQPQFASRVDKHLSEGVTALGAGLTIGNIERRQSRGVSAEAEEEKEAAPRQPKTGLGHDQIVLPFSELNTRDHAKVFPMSKDQPISKRKLVAQTSYRVQYRGKWMKATYVGLDGQAPAWMKPAALFTVNEVRDSFSNPVLDTFDINVVMFAGRAGIGGQVRTLMDTADLTGKTFGAFRVVSDPGNHPNKNRTLKVQRI